MNDGVVSIPCEDAGDGKVVVNLEDYRNAFRKAVCDGFGVEPGTVGLNSDYSMAYTPVVSIGNEIFPAQWGEVGQSPLEWAREHQRLRDRRGLWFWKLWFKGRRIVLAEWLYKIVSGEDFPKDW